MNARKPHAEHVLDDDATFVIAADLRFVERGRKLFHVHLSKLALVVSEVIPPERILVPSKERLKANEERNAHESVSCGLT